MAPGLSQLRKKVEQVYQAEGTAHAKAESTQHLLVTTKSSVCLEKPGQAREV